MDTRSTAAIAVRAIVMSADTSDATKKDTTLREPIINIV